MPRTVLALAALLLSLLLAPAAQAAVTAGNSASASGTGSATAPLTVDGANRLLAVGVSTLESATVTSVTYGAQVLTRRQAAAKDSSRAEVWTLVAPNPGTANVVVTLSTGAPVVLGATNLNGVDQQFPNLAANAGNGNNGANSASLVVTPTVEADGMFGVLTVNDSPNITAIRTTGSADTVVADQRWTGRQGTILSAGATRRGWTRENFSLYGGMGWFWNRIDPSHLMPYSAVLVAFKAAAAVPPTATSPTATNVTHDSATLGGSLTDTGGGNILERGVVYCACTTPEIGVAGSVKVYINSSQVPGALTTNVSGLTPSTAYSYRAYATNGAGTGYSDTSTFTTQAPPNRAPTADPGGEYTIDEGAPLTLHGSAADADGDTLTYAWDVNGDGGYGDALGADPTLTHAQLSALGLGDGYVAAIVRVRVSDGKATTTSAATRLQVANVAPTAALRNSGSVDEGGSATVSFTGQSDPADSDLRYAYDFGDDGTWDVGGASFASASTSASATVPAALLADGAATVRVRGLIIDKDGGSSPVQTDITVRNLAPTAKLADVTVEEGTPAKLALTDVDDVAADEPGLRYAYDFDDDGTFEITGSTSAEVAVPAALTADGPGTRTVRASVTDKDGGANTYAATLTVANVAPTATVTGPADIAADGVTALTVELTDPSATDTPSATITWGDDTTSTVTGRGPQTVTHTYAQPGAYSVSVLATDGTDTAAAVAHAVTVAARPTVSAPDPAPAPAATATPAATPAPVGGVLGAEATNVKLSGVRVTPRCIRAAGLKAVASAARTIKVQFRSSAATDVRFGLTRLDGKGGASKCPPATGVAQKGGRKVPGVYSPFSRRAVQAKTGLNTVTLAATTAKGKALEPGTYLLTITSGTVTARTKIWVLR